VNKSDPNANSSIRMGEMCVAADGSLLRTLLGSCVGVALYDRRFRIGGLAHIVLPFALGNVDRPGKFADTAIPLLIEQMQSLATGKLNLTAKLAGGASMFATTAAGRVGLQNVASCERTLGEFGIPVLGRHCGGEQGRRMSLDTASGKVVIEIVGYDPVAL
jgi:chemotaxis protein CheD